MPVAFTNETRWEATENAVAVNARAAAKNGRVCVMLVIDDFEYGGAQRQVVELANNLDPDRFDVHVCSLSRYVPLAESLQPNRCVMHIIVRPGGWNVSVVWRLARLLRTTQADVVHSYLFGADIVSRLAGRLAGTPVIVGSERNSKQAVTRKHKTLYRLTKGCIDLVIANSNAGAKFHRSLHGYESWRYHVVYNGVDVDRFHPAEPAPIRRELGIAANERVVGVFASFKPQKNHALFFFAARKILDQMPNVRLLLVGDQLYGGLHGSKSYRQRASQLVERLGIKHRCLFLGNRDDVSRLYPACDVTVLPSLYEGTPNVVLESMACGVPVVVTDVSDNARIVPDGKVGFVVPLGRADVMADRVLRILCDERLRRALARRGRGWAVEKFSTERLADQTAEVYLEGLARKRRLS